MPTNLPSSFASAAAGQNAHRDGRGVRADGRGIGSGDLSRRDGRSTNGTLTFRRSSTNPLGQAAQPTAPSEAMPHAPPFESHSIPQQSMTGAHEFDSGVSLGFSKDYLLAKLASPATTALESDVSRLCISGWNPGHVNGNAPKPWGRSSDAHTATQEPDPCWNPRGNSQPFSLDDLTPEEQEMLSTDVNSIVKPPQHNKDGGHPGTLNGRKLSLSHASGGNYGLTSPTSATRPSARRRETDQSPFGGGGLASPTGTGRFSRDDPSQSWFGRRSNDLKESEPEEMEDDGPGNPREAQSGRPTFGNVARSNTSGNAGLGSLWGQSPSAPSPGMGSFGHFSFGNPAPAEKGFGSTRGSRLAHLIPKDGAEGPPAKPEGANPDLNRPWRARPRTDTDPFGDDGLSSSALRGTHDPDAASQLQGGLRSSGPFDTPTKGAVSGDFGRSAQGLGRLHEDEHRPHSPTETNPYRSPPAERGDEHDHDDAGLERTHAGGASVDQASNYSTLSRGFGGNTFDGSDRSQTSSTGPRGYPGLSNLTGWPAPAGPSSGTPDRDRPGFPAFGGAIFGPMGDLQSPSLGALGSPFGSSGAIGSNPLRSGGSKLGSLFPPSMQAQMNAQEHDSLNDSVPDLRQANPLGAIGRSTFGQGRETDSPMRTGRGVFDEYFPSADIAKSHGLFRAAEPGMPPTTQPQQFGPSATSSHGFGAMGSSDPPAAQIRQMVLPDRMRWVYLDPQGKTQGPFTGLEMNDWYKANFFNADLRVRKLEDEEFEPLGQLIRKIGNSREPFLVPQIGIPHGAPPPPTNQFSAASSTGKLPPLSQVMPSYGRTLTAEEQNNLERRKQEEQMLVAQQRDYLLRQQAMTRGQMPGGPAIPGSLHHHSSAHSLQSQPSYGSMTSPMAMQPQPPIGALPGAAGFFEPAATAPGAAMPAAGMNIGAGSMLTEQLFREDDLANLTIPERQTLASLHSAHFAMPNNAPMEPSLRTQLPTTEQLADDGEGFRNRLRQFEQLRAEHEQQEAAKAAATLDESFEEDEEEELAPEPEVISKIHQVSKETIKSETRGRKVSVEGTLLQQVSLTQQVRDAQAAAAAAKAAATTDLPMPFPPAPAPSGTPLPAPTAQRARSNLPDQYNREQSETPETVPVLPTQPPPMAPWAGTEAQKGPSLKEIQEAEARQAAKQEAAAAARRAQLEQEAAQIREREKVAAAATGLATTSTWGNTGTSPVSATASPWAKPAPVKVHTSAPGLTSAAATQSEKRKTLAEIQREEEARKLRQKELAVQTGTPATGAGKRYADLASKPGLGPVPQPAPAMGGGGWATVGAGGKVKMPTGPATQPGRSVSASSVKPAAAPAKPLLKQTTTSASLMSTAKGSEAQQEFRAWLVRELGRGLNDNVNVEDFASTLIELPLESSIIAEAVYGCSKTMNGNHFAEEFIRRKKLADRGVVLEKQVAPEQKVAGSSTGGGGGGWNEVAKKGGHGKDAQADGMAIPGVGFKVVSGRKKGKK